MVSFFFHKYNIRKSFLVMEEEFRPVDGYPGYYVSNLGRVKSMKRKNPYIMSTHMSNQGYKEAITFVDKKMKFLNIGRAVLVAFRGYPAEPWLCYCNYKNGNFEDCTLDNLEWIVCETNQFYDPKKSHRLGVLKPDVTKERMSEAKFHQSDDTIRQAVMSRQRTINRKKFFKQYTREQVLPEDRIAEMKDIYSIHNRLNNGK